MALLLEVEEPFVRTLIAEGEHVLTLKKIEKKRVTSKFAPEGGDGKVDKLMWAFASNRKDDDGKPYEYAHFTGTAFGNEKAGMTLLLQQMIPDIDKDSARGLDLEELYGSRYNAMFRHAKDLKDPSKRVASLVYIMPYTPKPRAQAAPAPVVEDAEEEEGDPFAGGDVAAAPVAAKRGRKAA